MADSPYSNVNVSTHHATAWFPSVADELNSLYAWKARAQDNLNAAGRLDSETLLRMSNLAKVSPHLGPSVTPLALAGYGPDHPVSQWAMEQSARMHHATGGNLGNMGTVVAPWRLQRGTPQTRMRNALNALNSAGLIDDDGVLHEPNMDSGAPRYLWEQFTDAATGAQGQDIPYVNRHGEPSNVSLLGNAISRTTDSLTMARNMESRDYAGVHLRAQGFLPLADMIQPLMMAPDGNRVSLPASILQEAEDVGLLTPDGYLMEYHGRSAPRGEQGDPDYEVYNRIYRAFKEANIDLPFISDRAGPTIIRNSEGGHWEALQPQAEPQDADGGGLLDKWSEATQRPAVGGNVAPSLGGVQERFRQGVQVAGMAFNAPRQEVTGLVRNAYGGITGEQFQGGFQSDLAVWLEGGAQGELGSGYTVDPESAVAIERQRREATRGQIAGQNLTTGRIFANTLLEPGTTPYNVVSGLVDAGEAMFADPVDRAFAAGTRIATARRTFAPGNVERAGGIRGLFDFVEQPTAQTWLDGPVGTAVVDEIASIDSPVEIWRRTGRRLDPSFTARLADTPDPVQVRETLKPLLGTEFRRTDEVWRRPHFGVPRFSSGALRYLGQGVPDHVIDTYDLGNVVSNLERFGRIAGIEPERLDRYLNLASRAQSRSEVFDVTRGMMRETDGLLASAGMTNDSARRKLTSLFMDSHEGARKWFVDEIGSEVPVWSDVVVDGDPLQTGLSPHLVTELLTRNIELPDFRQVRRVMSSKPMRFLTTKHSIWDHGQMTGEQRIPTSLMEWTQTQLWKPIVLARVAWPVRVIGEEQVRMAAHGRQSMFNHPISYISWRTRKGVDDALGEPLAESVEHAQAMSRVRGGFLDDDPNRVRTGGWTVYSRNPDNEAEYISGWAGELSMLASDPVARQVARAGGREAEEGVDVLDEVAVWMREGQGRPYLDELIASSPAGQQLERPDVLRNYLATIQDRIRIKTGGDSDLLDMVRTGRLGDIGVFDAEGLKHTPDFTRALRSYWDIGPDAVKGQVMVHVNSRNDSMNRVMDGWNNAVDWAFGHLMSRRTNNLSRSPNFRQAYWARMEEMAGFADNVDDLEAAATAAGMNAKDFRRAAFRNRAAPEDRLDLENLDTVAKGYALDDTKQLLYDLSDRGAVADAMRLVAPFADAWQEVLGRWFGVKALGGQATGLVWQNPRVLRKGQQIIEGAQDSGFFYQDENTGEHMFTYPGSEFMTQHLLGVPIPMTGRAEGLSFMTQVLPGLGPAAQVPVAALLSNRPNMQWVREQLIPFGAPNEEGDFSPALDLLTYMPPWMKRAYTAITDGGFDAESNRQYANSQMRVAQYLSSTGDYNLEDPADFQRMMEDAGNKARWFYLIRSLAGYVAPSAPAPRWLMETSQGNMAIIALAEEHHRLQEANFETADDEFLSRFGDDTVLAMTPMSKSVSWGLVATREAYDWAIQNPHLQESYPSVYGLFGPQQSTPNDFDYGAYLAQFQSGERESLSPDEWMRMSQHMIATRIYRRAQRQVGANPTDEDSEWLANGRAWLREAYPGYDNLLGVPTGPNVESAMQELRGIVNEDGVRGTPVARAVQTYLTERDWAEQEAQTRGFRSFANAEDTRDLRDYLRSGAMELSQEVPAFRRVFDYVLSRELDRTEDEDLEEAASA